MNLYGFGFSKGFLDMTPKVQIKEGTDTRGFIKTKICAPRSTTKKAILPYTPPTPADVLTHQNSNPKESQFTSELWGFIKTKICASRNTTKKVKKQPTE